MSGGSEILIILKQKKCHFVMVTKSFCNLPDKTIFVLSADTCINAFKSAITTATTTENIQTQSYQKKTSTKQQQQKCLKHRYTQK